MVTHEQHAPGTERATRSPILASIDEFLGSDSSSHAAIAELASAPAGVVPAHLRPLLRHVEELVGLRGIEPEVLVEILLDEMPGEEPAQLAA